MGARVRVVDREKVARRGTHPTGIPRVLPDAVLAVTMQSSRSHRGDLAAYFSGALPAKYPPGIPCSFASEIRSPSHPATPPSTEFLRIGVPLIQNP
jgi:hypothetical protein